jgi:dynein heavy chain
MEWHEDLKKVLKMAGEANKKVVFLFADTQIKQESFVEDISNLLNTYEVPNLLQPADLATTFENIRPRAKAAGMDGNKDQLYSFFLQEVRPCLLSSFRISLMCLLTFTCCTAAVQLLHVIHNLWQ